MQKVSSMASKAWAAVAASVMSVSASWYVSVPVTSHAASGKPAAPQPVAGAPQAAPALLEFDQAQAGAANGAALSAEATRTCGAIDRRFMGELLQGSPLGFKVPYRLGDVTPSSSTPTATGGRQYYISGMAGSSLLGAGDFPFDHPLGSDFNMDVSVDPPYANFPQDDGVVANHDQHVELGAGGFPHVPQTPGVDGDLWPENSLRARTNLQPGFVPTTGDRVIVGGRWVNDCGHNNPFQTELHPISFLGWGHEDSANRQTVSQVFYTPYRETQNYNPDKSKANNVNDPSRLSDAGTVSFPAGLILSMIKIQYPLDQGGIDHLESWGLEEANNTSPVDWKVCAPPSASGDGPYVGLRYDFVARPGVSISYTADHAAGCVTMKTSLGTQQTPNPPLHVCKLPWTFLNEVAGAEAGVPNLDLKAELAKFVAPQFQSRLDADPIQDCYNPVEGPTSSANPTGQNVTTDPDTQAPFYGRVEVFRTTVEPPTTTTASTTSSSTTSSSSSSSSTPAGQKLTVTPGTVAQGATIAVQSSGWAPGATVTISVGNVVLGTLVADTAGSVQGSFTIPSTVPVGQQSVTAKGTGNDGNPLTLSTPITVTSGSSSSGSSNSGGRASAGTTSGSLPVTGSRIATFVAVGAVLVLVGLGVVAGSRRRKDPAATGTQTR